MNREEYMEFIAALSITHAARFGNVWWYSLLHEKNTTISNSYHNLVKGIKPKHRFSITKTLLASLRKYLSFAGRKFVFRKILSNKKRTYVKQDKLVISHPDLLKDFAGIRVVLPQASDWKSMRDEAVNSDTLIIDEFLYLHDFLFVALKQIRTMLFFLLYRGKLKKSLNKEVFKTHRKDIWRSFVGDVLVDGLFYERMFHNMAVALPEVKKVLYVYEGRAWEKALCIAFDDRKKIGILCSAPTKGILAFHYHPREVAIMPCPDYIGAMGGIAKKEMMQCSKVFTFVLGTARYNHLQQWMKEKPTRERDYVLVVLGSNKEQNAEIMDFVNRCVIDVGVLIKPHPDVSIHDITITDYMVTSKDLEWCLKRSQAIVAYDSMVSLEALALGVLTIVPELKSFADTNPLTDITSLVFHANSKDEVDDILQSKIKTFRRSDCRRFVNDYFTFNSVEQMQEIVDRI